MVEHYILCMLTRDKTTKKTKKKLQICNCYMSVFQFTHQNPRKCQHNYNKVNLWQEEAGHICFPLLIQQKKLRCVKMVQ